MASTSEKSAKKPVEKVARRIERKMAQQLAQQAVAQLAAQQPQFQGNEVAVHEDQILEAIDQLRRRKARPDSDRICNYLLRKYSVDVRDTINDLHILLATEKVIQVDYKGNTSYRNASKWTRLQLYKNRPEGFVKEKISSAMVTGAVSELVVEEPDYLDSGVPPARLINRLVEQLMEGPPNPTARRMVEDFLNKEVASGNLARLASGNFSLVASSNMNNAGTANGVSPAHQQNGDARSDGQGSGSTTPMKENTEIIYEANDYEDYADEHDSSSNTLKSSRHTSPKELVSMKKEDCYEIIVGRRPINDDENTVKNTNGLQKDDKLKQNGRPLNSPNSLKEESKTNTEGPPCKKSKTERKQRLCVRSDDSADLIFKYEDFGKDMNDKKNGGNERLSEDGENDHDAGISSTNPSPTPSNNNVGAVRSARRKRAKKVFDPSDNLVVKKKRGRHSNAAKAALQAQQEVQDSVKTPTAKETLKDPSRKCSLCSKDKAEPLTPCRDCTVRAHPSCIYSPEERIHKSHTNWQCEGCKTCVVCFETSESGLLAICFSCDDAYHFSCHSPRISATKAKWYCHNCNQKQASQNSKWNNNSIESIIAVEPSIPSPRVSPTRISSEQADKELIDPNIPDASDWSSEQVYQYFARIFPKEAEVFRIHEIDGASLLLMKRSDVLAGFNLLLGPALKMFRHIVKLQARRDDPKLYWL